MTPHTGRLAFQRCVPLCVKISAESFLRKAKPQHYEISFIFESPILRHANKCTQTRLRSPWKRSIRRQFSQTPGGVSKRLAMFSTLNILNMLQVFYERLSRSIWKEALFSLLRKSFKNQSQSQETFSAVCIKSFFALRLVNLQSNKEKFMLITAQQIIVHLKCSLDCQCTWQKNQ